MPRQSQQKKLAKQNRLDCPLCHGNHHVTDCDKSLNGMIASALTKIAKQCQRCGEATLGGPFCVGCTIDRALERVLGNVNQNRQ